MTLRNPVLRVLLAATVVAATATVPQPAQAALWTANCYWSVTFNFPAGSRLKSISTGQTSPSYSVTVGAQLDLDLLTPGDQACATTAGVSVFRTSTVLVGVSTVDDTVTCEAMDGRGTWTQQFFPSPPETIVAAEMHVRGSPIAGNMVMDILASDGSSVGTILLTSPFPPLAATACTGTGVSSLNFIGVEVVQDP